MPNQTTNFDFNRPLVNDPIDEDLWGGQLNDNWDSIDGILPVPAASKFGAVVVQSTDDAAFEIISGQGTSGQIFTSNGADALPSFQNAGATSVVETQTVSAVSTVTFNTGIDSTGGYYELRGADIDQSGGGDMRVRVEVSSSIQTGATDYVFSTLNNSSDSTSPNGTGSTGASSILNAANASTTAGSSLLITLPNPSNTSSFKSIRFDFNVIGSATISRQGTVTGFYKGGTGAVTGLQLSLSDAGTITGTFTLTRINT